MVQPVVTRTQRRLERKQVLLIVMLILAVAGASFTLGVLFGQRGGTLPGLPTAVAEQPKLPTVTQIAPPPPPVAEAGTDKQETLTFYENLPKGNQAPLGSGINLPPAEPPPALEKAPQPEPRAAASPPASVAKPEVVPAAAADGAFIVQIASFRTGEDAAKLVSRLKSYNLGTYVESADLGKKGVWHRVLAGPYKSREGAEQAAALLREKERLSALVRQR